MAKKKRSEEFEEKKLLFELQDELDEKRHERWMKGLKYQRESEQIHHENEMERQRIKSAEIRKNQERKEMSQMYSNG